MIITDDKFIEWQEGHRVIVGELRCSEVDELPEKNEDGDVLCQGNILAEGSIARVIQDGTFYELDSNGDWYCEGEKYVPTPPNDELQNSPPLLFRNFNPEPDEEVNNDKFMGNSESE